MIEVGDDAVYAGANEAVGNQFAEDVLVLALAIGHDRRQQHDAATLRQFGHLIDHLADGLGVERAAVPGAPRLADAGEEQAQIVVDLGDRADGGAGVVGRRLLFDGNGRRKPFDVIDIRLLHHREKLASVGGQGLDIAPLPLGIERVECQRRLAGTGQSRDHDQPVARNVEVDVLQIVRTRAAHRNRRRIHSPHFIQSNPQKYVVDNPAATVSFSHMKKRQSR